jgi:hypothetical protein
MELLRKALAVVFVQENLTQTDALWSALYVFVGADVFQSFFQREADWWSHNVFGVGTACTHIGQLFGLGYIHHQVVVARVFADHLTFVHVVHSAQGELNAVLLVDE